MKAGEVLKNDDLKNKKMRFLKINNFKDDYFIENIFLNYSIFLHTTVKNLCFYSTLINIYKNKDNILNDTRS